MSAFVISYQSRPTGRQHRRALRSAGKILGVIYGHGFPTEPIVIESADLSRYFRSQQASPMFDLVGSQGSHTPALLQEIQHDPVHGAPIHVDFKRVRMEERLIAKIPLELVGVSAAVKDLGGVLLTVLPELDVECLPNDLVGSLPVDIACLKQIHDHLRVRDLSVPSTLRILNDPEEIVLTVSEQKQETEQTTKPEEDVSNIEVVGKKPVQSVSDETSKEASP